MTLISSEDIDKLDETSNNSSKAFWARMGLNDSFDPAAFPVDVAPRGLRVGLIYEPT